MGKHGTSISYYKDGSKKRVIPYKNGKKDGKETEYFPRGNIRKEKVWSSGEMISEKVPNEKVAQVYLEPTYLLLPFFSLNKHLPTYS